MNVAIKYSDRIDSSLFLPQVEWRNPRNQRRQGARSLAVVSSEESVV
jgi:hypothetical protein